MWLANTTSKFAFVRDSNSASLPSNILGYKRPPQQNQTHSSLAHPNPNMNAACNENQLSDPP